MRLQRFSRLTFIASSILALAAFGSSSLLANKPSTELTQWEYFCFEEDAVENVMHRANAAGKLGWELTVSQVKPSVDSKPMWCFKRQLMAGVRANMLVIGVDEPLAAEREDRASAPTR